MTIKEITYKLFGAIDAIATCRHQFSSVRGQNAQNSCSLKAPHFFGVMHDFP
jgi:hypothetical protein